MILAIILYLGISIIITIGVHEVLKIELEEKPSIVGIFLFSLTWPILILILIVQFLLEFLLEQAKNIILRIKKNIFLI